MGALEVELEEQMMRESSGLSEEEEFGLDDLEISSDSFGEKPDSPTVSYDGMGDDAMVQPIGGEYTAVTREASAEVANELLGQEDEDELDFSDLDDLADGLDFDDLDDLAEGLDDEDDLDPSFVDDKI